MNNDDLELEELRLKRKKQLLAQQARFNPSVEGSPTPIQDLNFKLPKGIAHLTDTTFENMLENSPLPILIDYWAPWCQPCKYVAPVIEALEKRYKGKMIFAKVNVDENPVISSRFGITSIPTFHVWYQNKLLTQFSGALPGVKFDQKVKGILADLKLL